MTPKRGDVVHPKPGMTPRYDFTPGKTMPTKGKWQVRQYRGDNVKACNNKDHPSEIVAGRLYATGMHDSVGALCLNCVIEARSLERDDPS
jgi:hypothetical protein